VLLDGFFYPDKCLEGAPTGGAPMSAILTHSVCHETSFLFYRKRLEELGIPL